MAPRTFLLALPLLALPIAACSAAPPSVPGSMTVGLAWDVDPSITLDVQVSVDGRVQTHRTLDATSATKTIELPVDPEGDPHAEIAVEVKGFSNRGFIDSSYPVVQRVARTHFVAGKHTVLPIVLDSRCIDPLFYGIGGTAPDSVRCTNGLQCAEGACIPADVPESSLEDYTPAWNGNKPCAASVTGDPELEVEAENGSPLHDGDTLVTQMGGQGGHHVYLTFRAKGVPRKGATIDVRATEVGGSTILPGASYTYPLAIDQAGNCSLPTARWVVDQGGMFDGILGKTYDATFTLHAVGKTATVTRRIKL